LEERIVCVVDHQNEWYWIVCRFCGRDHTFLSLSSLPQILLSRSFRLSPSLLLVSFSPSLSPFVIPLFCSLSLLLHTLLRTMRPSVLLSSPRKAHRCCLCSLSSLNHCCHDPVHSLLSSSDSFHHATWLSSFTTKQTINFVTITN